MLIGNKKDLEDERAVSVEEGRRFAEANQLAFLEASAKNGDLIVACFETIVRQIYKQQIDREATKRSVRNTADGPKKQQGTMNETDIVGEAVGIDLSKTSEKTHKVNCCATS